MKIEGIDRLKQKFTDLQQVHKILRPPMQMSMMILQADLAKYPAQKQGTPYVRTGTLGKSWTTKVTMSTQTGRLVGRVGTKIIYAPFVQSEMFQADIHRDRWQTDAQILNRNSDRILRQFESAIKRALEA